MDTLLMHTENPLKYSRFNNEHFKFLSNHVQKTLYLEAYKDYLQRRERLESS